MKRTNGFNQILSNIWRMLSGRYTLLFLYLFVLTWLSVGVMVTSQWRDMTYIIIYAAVVVVAFMVFYTLLHRAQLRITLPALHVIQESQHRANMFFIFGLIFALGAVIAQFWVLGQIPVVSAMFSNDPNAIIFIRQHIITSSPSFVNYLTSICIRTVLPLLIMLALFTQRAAIFWFLVVLGTFFCCALIQKSYIALVFIPAILLAFMRRDVLKSILLIAIAVFSVYGLVCVTNPPTRPNAWNHLNTVHVRSTMKHSQNTTRSQSEITDSNLVVPAKANFTKIHAVLIGITSRVLIVPGEVVAQWFEYIPSKIPFGNGCGDRVLAKILHCPHVNYSEKMYAEIYPEQLKEKIVGTVNAASFMEWYANYGLLGLVIAGLELGFWLACISIFFGELGPVFIGVNVLFIILLSSVSLHTLLLSGGWVLSMIILYILKPVFTKTNLVGTK